jgi:hypothetical protein
MLLYGTARSANAFIGIPVTIPSQVFKRRLEAFGQLLHGIP